MRPPITVLSLLVRIGKIFGTACIAIVAMVWVVYEEIVDGDGDADRDSDLIPAPEPQVRSQSQHSSRIIHLSDFRSGRDG